MRRRLSLVVLALAAALLLAAPAAQSIVFGHPDGARHPFVGMAFQTGADAACSGTLISPTVFLTAGHCTDKFINDGTGAPDVQVTFAADARDYVAQVSGTPHTYPAFCSNGLVFHGCPPHGFPLVGFDTGDVGVVVLDTPVVTGQYGELPAPGAVDALPQGSLVINVGYGFTSLPKPGDFGLRSYAPAETFSGGPLAAEFLKTTQNPSQGTGGICAGDSGGPTLNGDTRIVLAVHAFTYSANGSCNGVGYSFRIDQAPVLAWIRSWMAPAG